MNRYLLVVALLAACNPSNPDNSTIIDVDMAVSDAPDGADGTVDAELQSPIRVLTWNVERYFDTVCDSGFCGDGDFEETFSNGEFTFRASQIADAIRDQNADIILFQEIEKEICVAAIGDELGFGNIAFGETFSDGSLDVGILTRGEIHGVVTHRDATTLQRPNGATDKFTREFLEVHIEIDGRDIIVFNAHFKSKFNDDPILREAEATAAREIILGVAEENPDALIVMGGDLNDTPDSAPLQNLTEGDALTLVSSDETWTYVFSNEEQAIDHLLFVDTELTDVDPESVQAVRDSSGRGLSISDHAALVATFGFTQ